MMFITTGLQPKKFETFIAVQALTRLVECSLLLWKCYTTEHYKKTTKQVSEALLTLFLNNYYIKCNPPLNEAVEET